MLTTGQDVTSLFEKDGSFNFCVMLELLLYILYLQPLYSFDYQHVQHMLDTYMKWILIL